MVYNLKVTTKKKTINFTKVFFLFPVLNTWNIYLLICSLWSLSAFILYTILPESPKYLLSQKKYDEARAVLVKVYRENTRKSADTYPVS